MRSRDVIALRFAERCAAWSCMAAAVIAAAFGPVCEARAEQPVTIIAGYGAGGGFDGAARLLAAHIGKYLPGNPTVVVQNMPGAGGLKAAQYLAAVAPKDGSTIAIFSQQLVLDQLLGITPLDFRTLGWVGSLTDEQKTCVMSTASPAATWQGMLDHDNALGGQYRGSDQDTMTELLRAFFGIKSKLVTGYSGTQSMMLALERREIDGYCGQSYGSFIRIYDSYLKNNKVRFAVYASPKDMPQLLGVPNAFRLAKTDEQRQVLNFMMGPTVFTRPFAAPPGLEGGKLDQWRKAFDSTIKDPGFLADAERLHYDIAPMTGAEMDQAIADIYATPPNAIKQAAQFMGGK
jgi:tripartite-type tricarboxylate transporter receptor subunit TctC